MEKITENGLTELRENLTGFALGGNKGFTKKGNVAFEFQGWNEETGRASDFIPVSDFLENVKTLEENGFSVSDMVIRGGLVCNIGGKTAPSGKGKAGKTPAPAPAPAPAIDPEIFAQFQAFQAFQASQASGKGKGKRGK